MADAIPLAKLRAADYNPRRITDADLADLAGSLDRYGDLSGIVYNVRSGRLVGGHQRVKVFTEAFDGNAVTVTERQDRNEQGTVGRGYIEHAGERHAVRLVDYGDEDEMRANVQANKLGGEFAPDLLAPILDTFAHSDAGLAGTGYDAESAAALLDSFDGSGGAPVDYGDRNREIDPDDLLGDDATTCPRCGFEFEE